MRRERMHVCVNLCVVFLIEFVSCENPIFFAFKRRSVLFIRHTVSVSQKRSYSLLRAIFGMSGL